MSDLEGLDAILASLSGLEERVLKSVVSAVELSAKQVQGAAKRLAPSTDTGILRNSIITRTSIDENGIEAEVAVTASYAPYIEFGTGLPGLRGETNGGERAPIADSFAYTTKPWVYYSEKLGRFVTTEGQPAQPFMYPAFQSQKEKIRKSVQAAVKKGVPND